jgi:hypothetical protein
MKFRLKVKEKLFGNEVEVVNESEDFNALKDDFDLLVDTEKILADAFGLVYDEWKNKRGYFFESYHEDCFNEVNTAIELVVALD